MNELKSIDNKSNKGEILEYRLKRLLFHMGNYSHTNIVLKTNEHIDNVIFVKNNVRFSAKEYALSLGIKVLGDDIIELLEKRYNIDIK